MLSFRLGIGTPAGAGGTGLRKRRHPRPEARRVGGSEPANRSDYAARARSSASARSSGSGEVRSSSAPGERVREAEPVRVQELPGEPEVARDAVDGVAADRQLDRLEVDAYLVRATGLQARLEERARADRLDQLEPCDGVAGRLRVERVARAVAPAAADGSVDPPGARPRRAEDEREIAALHASLADRLRESRVGLLRAGDHEEAGRVTVEAMDDARPFAVAARSPEGEQTVGERRALVHSRRVHDDPGGLVDDEKVLVLVDDLQGELDRLQLCARPEARPRAPLHPRGGGSSAAADRRRGRRRW